MLNWRATKVTDAGLKTLATFSNLRAVDLAHTAVTSAGVPILARLSRLESLNLTATVVDDAGVAALRRKQTPSGYIFSRQNVQLSLSWHQGMLALANAADFRTAVHRAWVLQGPA